jgi:hypothetical protein
MIENHCKSSEIPYKTARRHIAQRFIHYRRSENLKFYVELLFTRCNIYDLNI